MHPIQRSFRSFAVIPAAGRSTRMGQPKLLMPWGAATLIEAQLAVWRASPVDAVVVVVHPDDQRLAAICREGGADVVTPPSPPEEMKVSVGHALQHIAERYAPLDSDVWLLAPADMPLWGVNVVERVLAAFDSRDARIIAPAVAGRRGHPVLFPWRLAAEARRLGRDEGINALRKRHATQTLEVADEGVLCDIDTPTDYERLRTLIRSSGAEDDESSVV